MDKTEAYAADEINAVFTTADFELILLKQVGTKDETTLFVEMPTQDGYAAQDLDDTHFGTDSTDGSIANTASYTFTATNAWSDNVVGAAVRRKSDSQIAYYEQFPSPRTVGAGGSLVFETGQITASEA